MCDVRPVWFCESVRNTVDLSVCIAPRAMFFVPANFADPEKWIGW